MKNLFIINNIMQLINTYEAIDYFNLHNNKIIFIIKNEQETNRISPYIEPSDHIEFLFKKNTIKLIKHLQGNAYGYIFLGYFSLSLRQIVSNLTYTFLYILDDGTYTIALHNELYNKNFSGESSMLKTGRYRNANIIYKILFKIYYKLNKFYFNCNNLNHDLKKYNIINFFTVFELEQYNTEKIILHNYEFLKKSLKEKDFKKERKMVYFLGQPLPKMLNFLNEEDYLVYIKIIVKYYSDKNYKVKYIPHKSNFKIIETLEKEFSAKDLSILKIDKPFELYILEKKIIPEVVAGFFSSGIFRTKKIIPSIKEEFHIFEIPESREDIQSIYNVIAKKYHYTTIIG